MRISLSAILIVYSFCLFGQNTRTTKKDTIRHSKEQLSETVNMLKDLNTKGIQLIKDSVIISAEFSRILKDTAYKNLIYPASYTWEQSIKFINEKQLKKAFWYLINLYPANDKNKELVIKSVLSYDALFKMDEVLINTFYSYAFADPEICTLVDNNPEITRPDVLESKLHTVQELTIYINSFRAQKAKQK